ncbi:MAG: EF-P lysine aminoacylase GenX [Planctomycetota bacterium]|nr:MAG: EF-P lysine aminoacylase GenX [Planctomycetota bacterium]
MTPVSADWRPSCATQMLHVRAEMSRAIRDFFRDRDYLEVETPCLSRDIVLDACLEPFVIDVRGMRWFLQTSPEAHMKRLLATGVGSIFQFSRVFRQQERGKQHNPEFTMIEWYGVGSTWREQLEVTESLVRTATAAAARVTGRNVTDHWSSKTFQHTTYATAFQRVFGIDVFNCSGHQLLDDARRLDIPLPSNLREDHFDDILNVMLAFAIEPQLGGMADDGGIRPEFLYDYPPAQAALAVVSKTSPPVARRFELYIQGLELCNGYQELTDELELSRRDAVQNQRRSGEKSQQLPGAPRLLAAMQSGLPACSGVALGFDRLVMVATESEHIREVLAFPEERA